jgi:sporulation protein YlmC with PRC-barrel domain
MYWNELLGEPVQVLGQGRQAGQISDFYYDPETQSVSALRVRVRLSGPRVLLTSAIAALDRDGVAIENENMLIDETNTGHLTQLPLGSQLIGSRVVNEQGDELGNVSGLLLGINPPIALRISAFEIGRQRARRIPAQAITRIEGSTVTIMDQG